MKKVAIVTTHRANNFGAMLQAYSLVLACCEVGMDAEILDWRNPYYEWLYHSAFRFYRNPIAGFKRAKIFWGVERAARNAFESFREMLPMSRAIKSRRVLNCIESEYDSFIVGSDQVWNPINSAIRAEDFDRANLLSFVRTKSRNAYAASIGVEEIQPDSILSEFVKEWKRFDIITTREHAGAEYVRRLSEREAEVAVDPVLLHDAEFWCRVAKPIDKRRFLFLYNIKQSKALARFALELANKRGLELVTVRIPAQDTPTVGTVVDAGPAEFLSCIREAECVVTSSFHASAFSVIFSKELFVEQGRSKKSPNSRISSLFRFSGLIPEVVVDYGSSYVSRVDGGRRDEQLLVNEISNSWEVLKKMAVGAKRLAL